MDKKLKKSQRHELELVAMADVSIAYQIAHAIIVEFGKKGVHPADVYVACQMLMVSIVAELSDERIEELKNVRKGVRHGNQSVN